MFFALLTSLDLFLSSELFAQSNQQETANLCKTSLEALKEASAIRGLPVKQAVPCVAQDKSAVESFIHETIKTELPADKIKMEEIAYKAIGLIPDHFDYGKSLVDFLVGQIGGYYDPKKKRFVMASWLPESVQYGVAVHELTHALQDQHHDLLAILKEKKGTTDSDLAISALVEGDASAVMFDRESRLKAGITLEQTPSVDSLVLIQVLGLSFGSDGGGIPDSLKGILIFPYTSGLRFVHTLLRRGGYKEVERAYGRLPKSSREILHPDDYLKGTFTSKIPELSELEPANSQSSIEYTDVLGEFGISSLFSGVATTKPLAASAAAGWIGDRVAVFPPKDNIRLIRWLSNWESERDAQEFLNTYEQFIQPRYGKKLVDSSPLSVTDTRTISIKRAGRAVVVEVSEHLKS